MAVQAQPLDAVDGLRSSVGVWPSVMAGAVGNFITWFDAALYNSMAATIGKHFFPSKDPAISLLTTLAVFGVGFAMAPLGGFVFGAIADRRGRQPAMIATVVLMSGATLAMGFLPSYASIGITATIAIVFLRLLQGMAGGGEASVAGAQVAEFSPIHRRGFFCSFIDMGGFLAFFCGLGATLIVTAVLPEDELMAWGWRLPFMLSLPLGLFGLYLRLRIEESAAFKRIQRLGKISRRPVRDAFTSAKKPMLIAFGLKAGRSVTGWTLQGFLPSYLVATMGYSKLVAMPVVMLGLAVTTISCPLMGALSDRVGRKPMFAAAAIILVLVAYPVFLLIGTGNYIYAGVATTIVGLLSGVLYPLYVSTTAELFPTRIRSTGVAIPFNLAGAIFGGGAPFLSSFLIYLTGIKEIPSVVLIVGGLLAIVAVTALHETRGVDLNAADDQEPA